MLHHIDLLRERHGPRIDGDLGEARRDGWRHVRYQPDVDLDRLEVTPTIELSSPVVRTLVDGLAAWLDSKGFESVAQIKGSMSQRHVSDPSAFERANYLKVLQSWERTSSCGQTTRLK